MKSEVRELRNQFGEIRLFPETLDDIWHLSHLVGPGDLVFATTFRSVEAATDKLRPEKVEKRPVRLGIRVEKVEFHQHTNRLRIAGVIESGVDVTAHHTLNVEPGFEISVIKRWRSVDCERIRRAVDASAYGVVHIVSVEEGEAQVYRLRQFGPEWVTTVTAGSSKGADTGTRSVLFEKTLEALTAVTGPLVVAGPGFVKDEFANYVRARAPDLAERMVVVETRRIGRGAVQEVIGQGILERLLGDLHLAREVGLMDEVLLRVATGGAVAYGIDEVEKAIAYGAAETVLVSDTLLRDEGTTMLIERAERLNASVVVLSTEFEPGERLAALGGVAALLRYTIE
ncbi:MAG: mRNA surveillance protein pelota [Methanoculleus sp.]|uniref:mRNA surveillance protein pelota n=1 Tax=Methanoculleus sp. TaxID=90427 RepID=UPI0025D1AA4F|nr:mRNA surveillance protein pelota [Methanoculleus sp.]MCK9317565.1 mRNA surveillance protein pelota [Methanoculleus sp.]MDD2255031.1 mRNA surveillance protein pelota [Methanoculleus sp.]MDD3216131.1 mRNA surveillance protein pelota [Methanoculleus sp.]MDD4313841.1 mRNA surveillance protein pelota [Methanoculleus sp.]MDD4470061.1 mRNA surveillance protein pelota [Methanoculleus sp.]